jgi:signal transduction histidine kinase/NO-binding membrane sensor protein with MHYT domain/ActR/RegA family two-component response regulator
VFAVLTCIFVQHDLRLVAVAAAICSIACCSAFAFHARGLKASGAIRWAWLAMSALAAGSGVWATHFVAMLAYQPTLKIAYDLTGTVLSLVVAVFGMAIGFSLPAWRPGKARDRNVALIAGAAAGASIAVMHYTGIAAIRTEADVSWSMAYVAASILIGAAGGMAAFSARNVLNNRWAWAPPAGIFLLGIVGLHFTAMTAVTLTPDPTLVVAGPVMDRAGLALATGGLAALVLIAGAGLMLMERLGQHNTFGSVRHALNAVPAGLAFFDPSDRVQVWNGAYAALMAGCGIVVEAGSPRRSHIEAAAAAGWFPKIQAGQPGWVAILAGRAHGGGSEFHLPDGRWLRHESFSTADGGGVAVLTDITDQKHSAEAMAAARDAAEAANRAKSEFLANMSHEIRTPLNGVLGIADALVRTDLSAEQRSLVGVIQQSGGLLNGLLTDLLDLARVEAGAAELRPEPSALDVLVGSVRDLFAASAGEKGLTLRTRVDLGEGVVDCDAQRLRQVLGNLLNNAIKFTDAGEVVLSAERVGRRVRFAVRDTGPGFDPAQRETLFQRFHQADNSQTRKHGGAGLGLAICDQYVRLMGGSLSCESALGEGAVFDFTLDLPPRAAPVEAEAPAPAAAAIPAAEFGDGYRVLVVDDNAINRKVMELILESVGIAHASARDGAEGLAAMQTGGFDTVLMDIQMPVMDGFEATRRIREWERETGRDRAPILMVSANCLKEHIDAGRAAGADRHLSKPISAAELITALETQMAEVRRAA